MSFIKNFNPFNQHPKALPSLFMAELWERFSFYGIRPLIVLFMTASIMSGGFDYSRADAAAISGIFGGAVYLGTLPGGWLADKYLGQAQAVWWGSILIACGHLSIALAYFFGQPLFFIGLGFIVCGTGLFKTCMSVLVGRLYAEDDPRRDAGYLLFYMGINIGGLTAPLVTGLFAEQLGWHWGFGVGGIGMLISLFIYRMYVHQACVHILNVPHQLPRLFFPALLGTLAIIMLLFTILCLSYGASIVLNIMTYLLAFSAVGYLTYLYFFAGLTSTEKKPFLICCILFAGATIFWAANEQQPIGLTLFASDFVQREWFGFTIPAAWFYSLNPLFIILFAPLLGLVVQRWSQSQLSNYLKKFGLGLLFTSVSFLILTVASIYLADSNSRISPLWLVAIYASQSFAELCISPIGLAAISLLAPQRLQGQMMGLWFIAASLGNLIAGILSKGMSFDKVEQLPHLFGQTSLWLLAFGLLLFLMVPFVNRWLADKS